MDKQFMTGVVLTEIEKKIVGEYAEKKGLTSRGFSAALRMIIREWDEIQKRQQNSSSQPSPSDPS